MVESAVSAGQGGINPFRGGDRADLMTEKTRELRALTGLRGIAALSVALGHYGIGDLADILKVLYWKNAAVDLFFCLSGFTLCVAYKVASAPRLTLGNYFGARIARIYPLFVISLAFMVLLRGAPWFPSEHEQDLQIRDFVQQILMVNAWPFFGTGVHWIFPAWSVSVEFFCYLFVFPAAFHAAHLGLRMSWKVRAVLAISLMAVSTLLYLRYWDDGWLILGLRRWPGTAFPSFPYFVPLVRGILGMLAGWLVYFSYCSRDRFWQWATRWADLVAVLAIALLICGALKVLPNQWVLLLFPALILGLASEGSLSSRLAASKPLHYLGAISYSIYLLHIPWRLAFCLATGVPQSEVSHRPAAFLALLAGLILVAGVSYRSVEMPFRGLVRGAFAAKGASGRLAPVMRGALLAVLIAFGLAEANGAGLLRQPTIPPVALGEDVARPPTFQRVAGDGWSSPEDWGIWSLGHKSVLLMQLAGKPDVTTKLAIKGVFFVCDKHPNVTVHFSANGIPLATLTGTLSNSMIERTFDLPPEIFASSPRRLKLVIAIDNPSSPMAMGLSGDDRIIGFGLKSLMLVDGRGLP